MQVSYTHWIIPVLPWYIATSKHAEHPQQPLPDCVYDPRGARIRRSPHERYKVTQTRVGEASRLARGGHESTGDKAARRRGVDACSQGYGVFRRQYL